MEEIINEVSNNNNKFLSIRLIDFNVCNINDDEDEDEETHEVSSDFENLTKYDNTHFIIQMFGLDETRNTASINIINFKPYFFLKIDNNWNENKKKLFVKHLQNKVGNLYDPDSTEKVHNYLLPLGLAYISAVLKKSGEDFKY